MKRRAILASAVFVGLLGSIVTYDNLQVRAVSAEKAMSLPGDDLISHPIGVVNHAITIHRPPRAVWPWLVQMGAGRAGWYAYDFIDNGGHRSADRIVPEYQRVAVGDVMPAVPGAADVFVVARCDPGRSLVLAWKLPDGRYQTTWAFALTQPAQGQTRLIVRGRVAPGYRPYGLPQWVAVLMGRPAHFIMERKQLLGLALRAESSQSLP
jgi:hypothetical protein